MIRFTPGNFKSHKARSRLRRTGMILAMVLVALLVVMLLGAALANAFLAQRQLVRHNEQQQQAFWLADSALQRATHRFANEPGYEGETWQVGAEELDGTHAGVAVVRVEAVTDAEPGHRIIVDAGYPSGGLKKITQHRELFVAQSNE